MKNKNKKIDQSKEVDHSKFTGKDGYLVVVFDYLLIDSS